MTSLTLRTLAVLALLGGALLGCSEDQNTADDTQEPVADASSQDTTDDAAEPDSALEQDASEDQEDASEPDVPVEPPPMTPDFLGEDAGDDTEGLMRVLTYNVAGLPQGVSSSNPVENIPQISPLLESYDLVLAQEDFWYYEELRADVTHPYLTVPWRVSDPTTDNVGDGLNRFSRKPFGMFERVAWGACHGQFDCANDCLATKGFSFARTALANGVTVDVYNLHAEAGGCAEDLEARSAGVDRLIAFAQEHSEGHAMLVAGDFNMHVVRDPEDGVLFQRLLDALGLRDACWEVDCGTELIDRILVRSSDAVTLTPQSWSIPPEFVTADGEDLSDHNPVAIELEWSVP